MWVLRLSGRRRRGAHGSGGIGLLPSPTMSPRPATPAVAGHLYGCHPYMGDKEKSGIPAALL